MYAESFGEEPWPQNWEEFEGFDPEGVFLAKDGATGRFVGYVICFRRGVSGYISVAAVIPGFRRRNIGSALIQRAIEYLRSLQLTQVIIDVDVKNNAAIEVYKKLGFDLLNPSIEL
jgi:ribosomal protein S18 acetylase RimI-like enzyme